MSSTFCVISRMAYILYLLLLALEYGKAIDFSSELTSLSNSSFEQVASPLTWEKLFTSERFPYFYNTSRLLTEEDTSNHGQLLASSNVLTQDAIPSIAHLQLDFPHQALSNLDASVEETTTKRALRQTSGAGVLYRNVVSDTYNPYSSVSNINPLTVNTFDTITPRQDGLEIFCARRVTSILSGVGTKIRFADTLVQVGEGWDTQSSEFTTAVPGIYFFTFTAISDRFTYFRVSLIHNGAEVVSTFGDLSGYQMGSNSAILRLNTGDKVYLSLQEGRLYTSSSRAYTTLSGFRVL